MTEGPNDGSGSLADTSLRDTDHLGTSARATRTTLQPEHDARVVTPAPPPLDGAEVMLPCDQRGPRRRPRCFRGAYDTDFPRMWNPGFEHKG